MVYHRHYNRRDYKHMKKTLATLLALCMLLGGMSAFAEEAAPTYTYNLALADFPTNWNPHQSQTNTDSEILDWVSSALYTFDYNEDMDGYIMRPEMAAGEPVDVSANYVGEQWGIAEGETARAWMIPLRNDMKWNDGTPIDANDFVWSYRELLDPIAANYRADGMWTGNVVIANSEAYFKQNSTADTSITAYMSILGVATVEELLAVIGEEAGYIDWNYSFGDTYDFETKTWTGAAEDGTVDTGLTLSELYEFYTVGAGREYATWATDEDMIGYALDELYAKYTYPEMAWENVGIKATGDYELVFIMTRPLEGFYLKYWMTSTYLVHEAMYTACESIVDGVYTNNYGTAAENTMSYGPYTLTFFQSDKVFTLEKNPYWYGYADERNEGLYQATHIQYDCVMEPATRHEMFQSGLLDSFGLDADYIKEYATSDYTYYSTGDSVFAMVFNPDFAALEANQAAAGENVNKTILTVKEFRMAMSLGLDRSRFILATSPVNFPAFAIYGERAVSDPENGITYRTTDLAKQVIVDFWGLTEEVGDGKLYATLDDAIDSITGYNLEMAKQYFDIAYDKAIEAGYMDEDDVVTILVGTPNATSKFYNNGYDYIVNNYTEAVMGTKLEGKLVFERDSTLGNNFGNALRDNKVDMLFGVGWTGSTFDPYGLMQVYVSPNYQYDDSWDSTINFVDITLDDVVYTASANDWYNIMQGYEVEVSIKDTEEKATLALPYSMDAHQSELRMTVLAAMENAILQNYDFIPLMNDSSASLKGMQIEFYTEDELFPMGRGGVRFMTFNYSDAEWAEFVAAQGGALNYK